MRLHHATKRVHVEPLEARRLLSLVVGGEYLVGERPHSVTVSDFNGDGRADIAAAASLDVNLTAVNRVSVLLGRGDGTFDAAQRFVTDPGPSSILAGDFNGDGRIDLVAGTGDPLAGAGISLLLGNGHGTFQAPRYSSLGVGYTAAVIPGDLNNDGKLDLAAGVVRADDDGNGGSYTYGMEAILLGNADGTFAPPTETQIYPGPIPHFGGSGDFNGDGVLDIHWSEAPMAAGDFNGDGDSDLAFGYGGLRVNLANGDGTFGDGQFIPIDAEIRAVAVSDFNFDGKPDLISANYNTHQLSVLLGIGDGTFASPLNSSGVFRPTAIAPGDFNGDGFADAAVVNGLGSVSILIGTVPEPAGVALLVLLPLLVRGRKRYRVATFAARAHVGGAAGRGCSRKKRANSRDASGPARSV